MTERLNKPIWYEWIPGWLPICAAICGAALWIGQYTMHVNDRLDALEKSIRDIQMYLQQVHGASNVMPPISENSPIQQSTIPTIVR